MHLGQFLGFITGQHWRKPMTFATIEPLLGLTYTHMVCGGWGGGGTHFSYNGKLKGEKKLKDCNIYPMNNENMNNEKP